MASYDILGNIAIIKGEGKSKSQKLKEAKELFKRPNIKTVLEKVGNVKGRLRTIKVRHVAGEKNLIAKYYENGCVFKFDVGSCYFSPRLSNERKAIASKIRKKDKVLIMFAGVGVYPIIIYNMKKIGGMVGVELGRNCCKYFKENLKLNKIAGEIEIIQGDVKKKTPKKKFDIVIMARPNLKDSFLKYGLGACKKGGKIFYYGFCNIDEIDELKKDLIEEAKMYRKKIKVLKVVKAGEIAPYKFRWRIEIRVL